MKLNILSDLHLGFGAFETPQNDADAVILAGDISRPREAAAWALRLGKPVLYVPGNHEFYDASIDDALAELKRLCAGTPVHVLDDKEIVLDGVRFLGTTLWTDFELLGHGAARSAAMPACAAAGSPSGLSPTRGQRRRAEFGASSAVPGIQPSADATSD